MLFSEVWKSIFCDWQPRNASAKPQLFQTLPLLSDGMLFFIPCYVTCNGSVACRGLVMPGATAWLDAPLPNSSIEQWRMVVIVTGYMMFVTSQSMTSYLRLQTNVLAKFVDTTCLFRDAGGAVGKQSRRHGGVYELSPQAKLQAPHIKLWSTINRWSFYQISEC